MQNTAESPLSSDALNALETLVDSGPEKLTDAVKEMRAEKRAARRDFLKAAGVAGAGLAAVGLLSPKEAQAQRGSVDPLVLNFALNLEYLEADYYTLGTQGVPIESATGPKAPVPINGAGTQGNVIVKANPQVPFASADIASMSTEIAVDERAHAIFLRTVLSTLGVTPVARPQEDLLNSFNTAINLATGGAVTAFDPFASDLAFLLGAFIFEDVGVTAYKGGSRLLANKDVLENAAGILAVEAYHASMIRTLLFQQRATAVPGTGTNVEGVVTAISNLRDNVDNLDGSGTPGDDRDQPITGDPVGGTVANIAPTDTNGVAFSRTTSSVLKIVYLNGPLGTGGGFFPQGLNGAIR
jgi:hypothetical protein